MALRAGAARVVRVGRVAGGAAQALVYAGGRAVVAAAGAAEGIRRVALRAEALARVVRG